MQKQQTRRVLDKTQILYVFAQYLQQKYGQSVDAYLSDHTLLDNLVKNDKSFPWQDIAAQVNLDRWRLYHWYFETFQRMLAGSIDKEDVQRMREMIKKAMSSEEPLDKQFQQHVKQALSKEYHRSSFSIAFNNTKRQVMKELGKTELPTARPVIRVESHLELQQAMQRQQLQLRNQQLQQRQALQKQAKQQETTQPEAKPAEPAVVEAKSVDTPETAAPTRAATPVKMSWPEDAYEIACSSFITEGVTTCAGSELSVQEESCFRVELNFEEGPCGEVPGFQPVLDYYF